MIEATSICAASSGMSSLLIVVGWTLSARSCRSSGPLRSTAVPAEQVSLTEGNNPKMVRTEWGKYCLVKQPVITAAVNGIVNAECVKKEDMFTLRTTSTNWKKPDLCTRTTNEQTPA